MRALLLAGGLGTRLRPLTDTIPKCLVPIGNKTLLDYWLELLLSSGSVERVLINTHWLANNVNSHIAASRWVDRIDLIHENTLLGTGGTVYSNRFWFGNEPFIVAHADNLTIFDSFKFQEWHHSRPKIAEMTMMTFKTDDPKSCGIVKIDNNGIVTSFYEKSNINAGNIANGAVYIFEPKVIDFIGSLGKKYVDISNEVIPEFLGKIYTFHNTLYHRDIGSAHSLQQARQDFSK